MRYLIFVVCIFLCSCKIAIDKTVLLVGDSIMSQSSTYTSNLLLANDDIGYMVVNNAIIGTTFSVPENGLFYWDGRGRAIFDRVDVDVVAISLGSNDAALQDPKLSDAELKIRARKVLDVYTQADHVLWVLPHRGYNVASSSMLLKIRRVITEVVAEYSNVTLVNFEDYLAERGVTLDSMLKPTVGDVHLTEDGCFKYGEFIADRINSL